jgi:phage terminase large subunit
LSDDPENFFGKILANEKVQAKLAQWRDDPVAWVREVLGAEPEAWQEDALRAVVNSDRTSVKSGHGVGKSTMLAWTILWWLTTRSDGVKVAVTANTAHQLSDVLWSEIGRWRDAMKVGKGDIEVKSDKVLLRGKPDSFAVARVSRREQPEALQGFHAKHMLFVVDEASGVPDNVFVAAQGAMSTAGAKIIMTGNPTRSTGYFYDAFHGANAERWHKMTVSCADSTRVSPSFISDMVRQYGENSNTVRVRCLGEFPEGDDDTVVPRHLAEAATRRDVEPSETSPIVWGLDPARFGADRTALAKRQGNAVTEIRSWSGLDLMETAGRVKAEYDDMRWDARPAEILIDSIGLGSGILDRLLELDLPARGINVAESSAMGERFVRLRDELWWSAREWLEERNCVLPDDDILVNELCLPRYSYTSAGKIKVESKDESKKRYGNKSPDLADAVVLTFGSSQTAITGKGYKWSKPIEYTATGIV